VARESSEDSARESGGKLGRFKPSELRDEVAEEVARLEPGEFSKPFRTDMGIHIVRLDDRSGASSQPVDSLADEIKEKLYAEALEERYNRWVTEDLRKTHHVEILP
jgi:parvulin-like peptidyl-prolyl isomerase